MAQLCDAGYEINARRCVRHELLQRQYLTNCRHIKWIYYAVSIVMTTIFVVHSALQFVARREFVALRRLVRCNANDDVKMGDSVLNTK